MEDVNNLEDRYFVTAATLFAELEPGTEVVYPGKKQVEKEIQECENRMLRYEERLIQTRDQCGGNPGRESLYEDEIKWLGVLESC